MKVLLLKDVYKLGRAGDIKKVADGYGRNFLLPQKLAVLATAGALKQVEKIRSQAEIRRTEQNSELKGLADQINGITVVFPAPLGPRKPNTSPASMSSDTSSTAWTSPKYLRRCRVFKVVDMRFSRLRRLRFGRRRPPGCSPTPFSA